ncbi:cell filamentation protein Fic [Vibrio sp. 10N.261.45.A1]|uniref:Fic family protein n=1 Tax=Vibrio sp. 10N.261.45.A1 TaxID=1880841 RepID=UPI000C814968|nr:Fic family protein [Vibrio sp. 10N.261.45.A1]PMN88720.1 cell filamentation protein Fic [Vibrio sp. 10N.261.45.A1]
MWIWERAGWPAFDWNEDDVSPLLREIQFLQGLLLGQVSASGQDQNIMLDTLLANIVHSSAIEGEKLNAFSVRSSLSKKLGLTEEKPFPVTDKTDGLAEIMLDAINNLDDKLNLDRILGWHKLLFPENDQIFNTVAPGELRGDGPMQVVSGRIDRPVVHFEAPQRDVIEDELDHFFDWFNMSRVDKTLDPVIRAAITDLWFVSIHPLDDGNGRVTRLLTDMALAQAENSSVRFYAMSVSILDNRKAYYEILEKTQRGDVDITEWLVWFLETLKQTINDVLKGIEQTMFKVRYWAVHNQGELSEEQSKVLNRMLDGDFEIGINTSQYASVAKVSKPTATRHLAFLTKSGYLEKSGAGGRSTRYILNKD